MMKAVLCLALILALSYGAADSIVSRTQEVDECVNVTANDDVIAACDEACRATGWAALATFIADNSATSEDCEDYATAFTAGTGDECLTLAADIDDATFTDINACYTAFADDTDTSAEFEAYFELVQACYVTLRADNSDAGTECTDPSTFDITVAGDYIADCIAEDTTITCAEACQTAALTAFGTFAAASCDDLIAAEAQLFENVCVFDLTDDVYTLLDECLDDAVAATNGATFSGDTATAQKAWLTKAISCVVDGAAETTTPDCTVATDPTPTPIEPDTASLISFSALLLVVLSTFLYMI